MQIFHSSPVVFIRLAPHGTVAHSLRNTHLPVRLDLSVLKITKVHFGLVFLINFSFRSVHTVEILDRSTVGLNFRTVFQFCPV